MSSPRSDFDFPSDNSLLLSDDPQDRVRYQEYFINNLKSITSQLSQGIYGNTATFKPTAIGGTVSGTASSYTTQLGLYTRFGHLCWFSISIAFTDANHTGTGDLIIEGLPVKSYEKSGLTQIVTAYSSLGGSEFTGVALIAPGTKQITPIKNGANSLQINGSDTSLLITGVYRVA